MPGSELSSQPRPRRRRVVPILLVLMACGLFPIVRGCRPPVEPAELVVTGGKIVTLDPAAPEAEALAVRGGELVALGPAAEIARYRGDSTRVIELSGELVIPGFIEGHGHFLGLGLARMQLDLTKAKGFEDVVAMVAKAAAEAPPGAWIEGRGWHQDKWTSVPEPTFEGLPTHATLSAVSQDHPVLLRHASGHAVFANAKAMELGGVTRDTVAPAGGEIVKDDRGEPIGVFRETAASLVARRDPASEAELRRMVELASEECLAKGITSFQDAGTSVEHVGFLQQLADEGALRLRLWVMLRDSNENLAAALPAVRKVGYGGERLTVRAIKHSIDGALGSHGAWLLAPYTDHPESTGLNTTPVETIAESASIAREHDLQLCVHAIGDRANRETLDVFERAYGAEPGRDLRWRVEHAQHLDPAEIPRFAKLGAIASMQAVHCTSDGPWVPVRLGEERSRTGAYVWRKLLEAGVVVTNGTDAPVEDVSPIASYYSAVSRRMGNGEVFYGDQVMSREEALRAYTLSNAFAAFEEDRKGSLVAGKLADLTILSQDVLTVPEAEIPETEVLYTIVGGKIEYQAPSTK